MNEKKALLGLILFIIGLAGVASLLTMDFPLPIEVLDVLEERFSDEQIKYLLLVNPTIFLFISIIIGTIFYEKVNLKVPIIESFVGLETEMVNILDILKYGIIGGVLSGVLISFLSLIYQPFLPEEFIEIGESLKPSLAARFLYGGITEELLLRFGLMSFLVWLLSKIFKGTPPTIYWIGIIVSALLFALGHFPIAYQAVASPSIGLLSYILIGNSVAGLFFGWLYWKKGLESAMIAHIFAHVVMVSAEQFIG